MSKSDAAPDELIPDPQIYKEFGISAMTAWRWDRDPDLIALGWPPPINIHKRKFRSRKLVEQFRKALLQRAIKARGQKVRTA